MLGAAGRPLTALGSRLLHTSRGVLSSVELSKWSQVDATRLSASEPAQLKNLGKKKKALRCRGRAFGCAMGIAKAVFFWIGGVVMVA